MSLLTDLSADTSTILADWQTSVTFERASSVASTAGEAAVTWVTNLATMADVQDVQVRNRRRGFLGLGGYEFSPEKQVFLRAGIDVKEGDRFRVSGEVYHVNSIYRGPDHTFALASRRSREAP